VFLVTLASVKWNRVDTMMIRGGRSVGTVREEGGVYCKSPTGYIIISIFFSAAKLKIECSDSRRTYRSCSISSLTFIFNRQNILC